MGTLVTGVTGILGSIIGPMLEDDAIFLVRGGATRENLPVDPKKVFEADITKPLCSLSTEHLIWLKGAHIEKVLHLAANVSFEIEDTSRDIWKTNFEGTENVLALAREIGVEEFHHCSTAFADDQRNPYEKSKKAAEELVINSGMKYSIYRPSAMVGDSRTGETSDFNGYYGVYVLFHLIAERERNGNKDMDVPIPVWVVCSKDSTINLISTDWVKFVMLSLFRKVAKNEIYNITHPNPPNARWVMTKGFEILRISEVKYLEKPISREEKLSLHKRNRVSRTIQAKIDPLLDRYIPYVTFERRFNLETTKQALGVDYVDPAPVTENFLALLLKYAVINNFGHERKAV